MERVATISVILITSILASAMIMIFFTTIIPSTLSAVTAQPLTTMHKREVAIELEPGGGGLQTKGELTIPAVENGTFSSGAPDSRFGCN